MSERSFQIRCIYLKYTNVENECSRMVFVGSKTAHFRILDQTQQKNGRMLLLTLNWFSATERSLPSLQTNGSDRYPSS
jgi:hypothetical protein